MLKLLAVFIALSAVAVIAAVVFQQRAAAKRAMPLKLVSPVGADVADERPVFRWESAAGAISFHVNVYDSQKNVALASPSVTGTEWTASGPLKPGEKYKWTVTAHYDFKDITVPGSFRVRPTSR